MWYGDFRKIADTANIIIVHPQGLLDYTGVTHWNLGQSNVDDIGFLNSLYSYIVSIYNINLDKVYSTGMSNGGYMSYYLACNISDKIAAIASVTGSMGSFMQLNCNPTHPTPVMEIHGTADVIVPFNNILNGIEVIENEIIDGKLIAKENSNKILHGNTFISSIGSLPEPIQGIPMDGSTYNIVDEDSGKFDELEKVHGMGNAITGKGNIKASRVSAKTVGDLTIDLIHDIDQDVINNIDSKVKEWQSKSSYDGNYFEWKAKK